MKSKLRLSIALLGLAAALPSQAAEIAVPDLTQTPTADATQQNDVSTPNGGNLNNTNDSVTYYVTTFTFGAGSQAHIETFFELSAGQDRLGIRVQDTGVVDFLNQGDPGDTTFSIGGGGGAGFMAGETVTLITRSYRENGNWLLRFPNSGSGSTMLMNAWVNPDFSATYTPVSPGAADMPSDGDLHTLWDSNNYFYLTQRIRNEGTLGGAGDNEITDTTVLTGAEATFPRALEYALEGGPTAPGVVSAYISTVSASPVLVPNDNTTASTITVTLTDSAGDPVAGKVVSLASDGDASITTPGSNTSDASGEVTFEVKTGTDSVQKFTATNVTDSNMVLYQTTSVTFEPVGSIDPDTSTVEVSLPDVPADDSTTSTITVTLRNSLGDPVQGKTVSLTGDTGDATISANDVTDVNGEATFTVRSDTQGTEIFTATDVTGTPPPASIPLTQTVQVIFTEVSPTPAILFHEPFDYADGSDLNGQGGWTAGSNTAGAFAEVFTAPEVTGAGGTDWDGNFTGVTKSPTFVGQSNEPEPNGADHVYGGKDLDPSVTATFVDGAVTWLSFLAYEKTQVAIGAGVFNNNRGESATGQMIGAGGAFNSNSVRAHYWDDENASGPFEDIPSLTTLGSANPAFVISKIVWSDGGVDSITCARFTSGSTISEAEFNAASKSTISADLDQSIFDKVSFAGSNEYVDEIRIATTFDEAVNGTLSSGSDYDTWAGDYPGLGAAGEDDDGDGLTNDEERIFGLNPQNGASANPYETPFDVTDGSFSYTRRTQSLTGLTYKVWYSTDLEQWFEDILASQTPGTPTADVEIVDVQISASLLTEPKLFIQISADNSVVTPPPPAPELSSLWGSANTITLNFSEAMNETLATDMANYTVELDGGGSITVSGASLSGNGKTVTLTLGSALGIDSAYNVAMSNLTGSSGQPLGGSGTAQFLTWDDDPTGIKVFILGGQSNMVGYGKSEDGGNPAWTPTNGQPKEIPGGFGCLRYLAKNNASFPVYDFTSLLVDPGDLDSAWKTRSDVKVWWHNGHSGNLGDPVSKGDLGPPFKGANAGWFGPEYAFGQVLGDYYTGANEDVLIIKTAWGGHSLGGNFRPPSAVADRGGVVGASYLEMIANVREVLSSLSTQFPEWSGRGYQIVGFGWHQGVSDGSEPFATEYKDNLPDLISDVRSEFGKPNLPFVIASTGMQGVGGTKPPQAYPYPDYTKVEKAQLWVAGVTQPANVLSDDTRSYWREADVSPSTVSYHWNHSAESYFLVGKALGDNMVDLLNP